MIKTTQESGRSMVEMLGVLAVIGVLSVGGISGYTLAMNKHRANSVAADLMKRAVVISAQRQLGQQNLNMNGFNNQVGDYEIDQTVDTSATGKFGMTVKAVPQEVCEKILALDWDNATITPANCEQEKNNMTFTYNNDLSSVTGSNAGGEGTNTPQEPTCTGTSNGCQKCDSTTGEWVADETLNGQACGEGGVCANGACAVVCDPHESEECCKSVTITDALDNRHFVEYDNGDEKTQGCYNYVYRLVGNGDGTYKAGTTADYKSCQDGFLADEGYCCEYNESGRAIAGNLGGFLNDVSLSQRTSANEACLYHQIVRNNSTYICYNLTANDLDSLDADRKQEILTRCGLYEVNGSFYICSSRGSEAATDKKTCESCMGWRWDEVPVGSGIWKCCNLDQEYCVGMES